MTLKEKEKIDNSASSGACLVLGKEQYQFQA